MIQTNEMFLTLDKLNRRMRSWEDDCRAAGAVLACDSVICQETPDADALAACEKLGEALK